MQETNVNRRAQEHACRCVRACVGVCWLEKESCMCASDARGRVCVCVRGGGGELRVCGGGEESCVRALDARVRVCVGEEEGELQVRVRCTWLHSQTHARPWVPRAGSCCSSPSTLSQEISFSKMRQGWSRCSPPSAARAAPLSAAPLPVCMCALSTCLGMRPTNKGSDEWVVF